MTMTPASMEAKSARCVGSVPAVAGTGVCRASEPARRQHEHDGQESSDQHRQAEAGVVEVGVGREAGEGRPVVVRGGHERVQHLGQTVRPVAEHGLTGAGQSHREAGADEHGDRHDQDRQRHQLDLAGGDLLLEVLRCPAHHQSRDEHRDDRQHEDAVETAAHAAGRHLAEPHVEDEGTTADRVERRVERVDRPGGRAGRGGREQGRARFAEAGLLALHRGTRRLQSRTGMCHLHRPDGREHGKPEQGHRREDRVALTPVADQHAERPGQTHRDQQQQEDLEHVAERIGVLERVR